LTAAEGLDDTPGAWRVVRLDAVDSTNEEARRRALAGDPGRLWIVADEQRAGRGRRGRTWLSLKGNLHVSALLIDPCPPPIAPQLGFVAGVALARAATDVGAVAGLKWPNDLLSRGAKCAGLLVEGIGLGGARFAYAVGVGVNCAQAPDGLDYPATRLRRASGRAVDAGELFERLARRFDDGLAEWRAGEGFPSIRRAWLDFAHGLGRRIAIKNRGDEREGVFEGIDGDGRLLLRSDLGLESIEAADLWISSQSDSRSPVGSSAPPVREGRA
jgi:BirA family biotin operon repressor/biotin-[acetyl-CoA-carboxylase] ligase